jgi:ABC-type transporter Mla subunit MlaD
MRRTSPLSTLATSPTLVGAVSILIVAVTVFLAYNANSGLPFVPTYKVSVEVPNAARLVKNNEVRIGGVRVGVVESIEIGRASEDGGGDATLADDDTTAILNLKLDESSGPLPKDSMFRVRYRSSFGLKYLEITRGEGEAAPEGFVFDGTDDGQVATIDEAQASDGAENGVFIEQTEFDDIGNTFDTETRENSRINLIGFGNAFAGRGTSLNQAIAALSPLFRNAKPVAKMLVEPATQLRRLFPALGKAAAEVAPVATEQAELFGFMAQTFEALSRDTAALQEAIVEGPPTLEAGISLLPRQRPFLQEFTTLSSALRPGVSELRTALPTLNSAIDIGIPVLTRSPLLNDALGQALGELEQLVDQPSTLTALDRLTDTFNTAEPLAKWVVPAQTVCNYWNYWFTYLTEHITQFDGVGYSQRVSIIGAGSPGTNTTVDVLGIPLSLPGEEMAPMAGYSGLQSNGRAGDLSPHPGVFEPFLLPILHGNPYGPTGQPQYDVNGVPDCQAGQSGYLLGQLLVPGQGKDNPAVGVPNLPGARGVTSVFLNQDGTRQIVDSRNPNRQPE